MLRISYTQNLRCPPSCNAADLLYLNISHLFALGITGLLLVLMILCVCSFWHVAHGFYVGTMSASLDCDKLYEKCDTDKAVVLHHAKEKEKKKTWCYLWEVDM